MTIFNTINCNYKCTKDFSADICAYCFFHYSADTNDERLAYCSKSGYFTGNADELLLTIYYSFKGATK